MKTVSIKNIQYGELVEVLDKEGTGYHAGRKVHFFNKNGVLVGGTYEFLPYERLRHRRDNGLQYPRYFMGRNYLKKTTPLGERLKTWAFVQVCRLITFLLKSTQNVITRDVTRRH